MRYKSFLRLLCIQTPSHLSIIEAVCLLRIRPTKVTFKITRAVYISLCFRVCVCVGYFVGLYMLVGVSTNYRL